MKLKKFLPGIGAFLGMLILILDGKTALEGATYGMELSLKSVVPALFPFFVLSILLTGSLSGIRLPLLTPIGRILGIPKGCESVLIPAFLGGYPAGAQCVTQLYHSHHLDKQNAERMLSFCSNAGPAFLFGILGPIFSQNKYIWVLWGTVITGAILTAILFPPPSQEIKHTRQKFSNSSADPIQTAIRITASVCAWIILFRVFIAFLQRWFFWLLPATARIAIIGFLELSNGCLELIQLNDLRIQFLLCSGFLVFGGVCVAMQTVSVTKGLSLKYYFAGKILQTIFTTTVSMGLFFKIWIPFIILSVIFSLHLIIRQKKCSILESVGV